MTGCNYGLKQSIRVKKSWTSVICILLICLIVWLMKSETFLDRDGDISDRTFSHHVNLYGTVGNESQTELILEKDPNIAPRYINGTIILQKNVSRNWNLQLSKWRPKEEILAFIHIGKSAGTSLGTALANSVLLQNNCTMKGVKYLKDIKDPLPKCDGVKPILCGWHFDWSTIIEGRNKGLKMTPIILFREPVQRWVSHFYYARIIPWTEGRKIRNKTLGEYLNDSEAMMESRFWYDGQGAASWLAGTHIAGWVKNVNLSQVTKNKYEQLSQNWTYMLNTVLDNLHQCLWIGIVEKLDQSIEMLEYQTGLKIKMIHTNITPKYPKPTDEEVEKIKKLMPLDWYIYNYAKCLFNNRWKMYIKEKKSVKDEKLLSQETEEEPCFLPSIIHGCKSTIHNLWCPDGQLNYKHYA